MNFGKCKLVHLKEDNDNNVIVILLYAHGVSKEPIYIIIWLSVAIIHFSHALPVT